MTEDTLLMLALAVIAVVAVMAIWMYTARRRHTHLRDADKRSVLGGEAGAFERARDRGDHAGFERFRHYVASAPC